MNFFRKLMWKLPTKWYKQPEPEAAPGNMKARACVQCIAKVTKADGTVKYYHSRPTQL